MSMQSDNDRPTGVQRIRPGDLPRNHHGDQVAPLDSNGQPYRYAWHDQAAGELVYASTADDLLDEWIPGYLEATPVEQSRARAEHAVTARTHIVATIAAGLAPAELSNEQEGVLLVDLQDMPDVDRWDPQVPLVLLEGMYRPFTDRMPPLSGIDGDVVDPSNILWLRHSTADGYLQSLARAGYIDLDVRES